MELSKLFVGTDDDSNVRQHRWVIGVLARHAHSLTDFYQFTLADNSAGTFFLLIDLNFHSVYTLTRCQRRNTISSMRFLIFPKQTKHHKCHQWGEQILILDLSHVVPTLKHRICRRFLPSEQLFLPFFLKRCKKQQKSSGNSPSLIAVTPN